MTNLKTSTFRSRALNVYRAALAAHFGLISPEHAKHLTVPRGQRGVFTLGEQDFGDVPGWAQLRDYANVRPDAIEAIRQPLYDRQPYPAAGSNQIRMFQVIQGQGASTALGNFGNPKTLDDTNMEAAGTLPSPKAFLATSIEVIFEAGLTSAANNFIQAPLASATNVSLAALSTITNIAALNDVLAVLMGGWLQLEIISKPYLTNARLDSFPPKTHIAPDAAVAVGNTISTLSVGIARAVGRPYYLNPPVLLMPTANFVVTLNWQPAVAPPSGFVGRIMVRMDGVLYRNAQ